jgi:hypothetical protein
MSENKRSFWSSVPGLVTGLAGLLTGIVGLITLLVQLDVIGGDKTKAVETTGTAVAGSPSTVAGSPTTVTGNVTTTLPSSFSVSPTKLSFTPTGPKELQVTVRNTSVTTDLRLATPSLTGNDKDRFDATLGDCPAALKANAICNLKVTFTPSGPLKNYAATLQVSAQGAPTQQVDITASTLL